METEVSAYSVAVSFFGRLRFHRRRRGAYRLFLGQRASSLYDHASRGEMNVVLGKGLLYARKGGPAHHELLTGYGRELAAHDQRGVVHVGHPL